MPKGRGLGAALMGFRGAETCTQAEDSKAEFRSVQGCGKNRKV
jgi:hypothetical protein